MILKVGEKVLIIERRYFAEDIRRHFVGEIIESSENAFRVKGHAWVFDTMIGFVRKPEVRERVFYPNGRTTINIIPKEVNLDEIEYRDNAQKSIVVTDGKKLSLDITEFVR